MVHNGFGDKLTKSLKNKCHIVPHSFGGAKNLMHGELYQTNSKVVTRSGDKSS